MTAQTPPSFSHSTKDKLCPRIVCPSPDCYCVNLTSGKIPAAIKFCGGNYDTCNIYLRNTGVKHEA